ncbi:MAG: GDSL-type esterase/lipase family protein [Bacteroidota bacterium]
MNYLHAPQVSRKYCFILIILLLLPVLACKRNAEPGKIHIPLLQNVRIDGSGEEYENAYVAVISGSPRGVFVAPEDFEVRICLGWTKEGIALYAEVKDDTVVQGRRHAWEGDGLEIFIADSCGSDNTVQYSLAVISPADADTTTEIFDRRYGGIFLADGSMKDTLQARCRVSSRITGEGYGMELLIPFDVLFGTDSIPGRMAMEVWVNDCDSTGGERTQYTWNYSGKVLITSWAMYTLVPDSIPSAPALPVRAQVIDDEQINLQFPSDPDLSELTVRDDQGRRISYSIAGRNEAGVFNVIPDVKPADTEYLNLSVKGQSSGWLHMDLISRVYQSIPEPNRYEEDIRCFGFRDRMNPPEPGATLFVGSSSIVMWKTLSRDMQGTSVLNRGFGGSTATDLLHYFNRVVLPYKPSRIVYYEGDNDIGGGMPPAQFADSTRVFISRVKGEFPGTEIFLLSVKPSFARIRLADRVSEANELLREIAHSTEGVHYIDVSTPMYDEKGQLRKDIFLEDGLHMNSRGYEIWTGVVREALGLPAAPDSLNL